MSLMKTAITLIAAIMIAPTLWRILIRLPNWPNSCSFLEDAGQAKPVHYFFDDTTQKSACP